MKRLIALALTVIALAAVPVAFGDDGTTPPDATAPATTQAQGRHGNRLEILRLQVRLAELRFAKQCGASSSGAAQQCLDFATKAKERLTKLDAKVQDGIAKIQETCVATSTDPKCKHAAERIAALQKVGEHVKALAQKVQDWLDGKTVSFSTDQPTQQAGGNG
jgi:predicted outer membrane protein